MYLFYMDLLLHMLLGQGSAPSSFDKAVLTSSIILSMISMIDPSGECTGSTDYGTTLELGLRKHVLHLSIHVLKDMYLGRLARSPESISSSQAHSPRCASKPQSSIQTSIKPPSLHQASKPPSSLQTSIHQNAFPHPLDFPFPSAGRVSGLPPRYGGRNLSHRLIVR
jgi:hypothetical protein